MKVTLKEYSPEIAKYYCDKHNDIECYSELKILSWYGSKHDNLELRLHLCDDCVQEFYSLIKEKYKIVPEEVPI